MAITGIDAIVFGVEDMGGACRFFEDFGLTPLEREEDGSRYRTANGVEMILRRAGDPTLPAAVTDGPGVREIVWGVDGSGDIEALGAELARDRPIGQTPDGVIHAFDDDGYGIAFRRSSLRPIESPPAAQNVFGGPLGRPVNARVNFDQPVLPIGVGHVVLFTPEVARAADFYLNRLGFRISDSFREGRGSFLRAPGSSEHHNLFLMRREEKGLHHVAFHVRGIDEVMIGGLSMVGKGWSTKHGPGRHRIASSYFWYFDSPCGGAMEYSADSDRADENWEAREWDFLPTNTAVWLARA